MTEYVRVSPFSTAAEIKEQERRKAALENAGYILAHESALMLTYRKPYAA